MQNCEKCIAKVIKDSDRDIPNLVHTDRSNVYFGIEQTHKKVKVQCIQRKLSALAESPLILRRDLQSGIDQLLRNGPGQ